MAIGKHAEESMEEQEIDLTPLIDCFLMLIIFFSCLEFKSLEAKLPAYLPKDVGSGKQYVAPQEKLSVKIWCDNWGTENPRYLGANPDPNQKPVFWLKDHRFHWEVGPKRYDYDKRDQMLKELQRIADDKTKWQKDEKTGQLKKMTVVIEPGPEVAYGDVAETVDIVLKAGFEEINFGGGLGGRKGRKRG